MFFRIISTIIVAAFLLTACAAPQVQPTETPNPDGPVSSDDPGTPLPDQQTWEPKPGDADLDRTDVILDQAQILVLESYPPQFRLNLAGALRSGCDQLRVDITEPDSNGRIMVSVYSVRDPDLMCTDALVPFNESIPLEPGQPGLYEVFVNEQKVGEIEVPGISEEQSPSVTPVVGEPSDVIPVEGKGEEGLVRGNVFIENSAIVTDEAEPRLFLSGYLPTPCHKLEVEVSELGSDGALQVSVYSLVDPDLMCIQVTEPFETSIPLVAAASASYQLVLNGENIGEVTP